MTNQKLDASSPEHAPTLLQRLAGLEAFSFLLLLFVATTVALRWNYEPPLPLTADAPVSEFSATRAEQILARVATDAPEPHLTGSPQNTAIRQRLELELQALGLSVSTQRARICNRRCAYIENIIATDPHPVEGPGLVVSAHYDSVASGPGIADDLASAAAIVEVARAMRARGDLRRANVTFLITDGEEMGLFGAHAFDKHPSARDARFVINLEARGTDGPSYIFETGPASQWTIDVAANALTAPAINSLAPAVYERLPNGSDLHVHKASAREGMNFGFFAGLARYHTPLDDMQRLDRRSLQHQGQNTLQMASALAREDLSAITPGRAVFFDVARSTVVSWPEDMSLYLLGLAGILWLLSTIIWTARGGLKLTGAMSVGFHVAAMIALTVGGGLAFEFGARTYIEHSTPWRASLELTLFVYTCIALFSHLICARVLYDYFIEEVYAIVWILVLGSGIPLVLFVPGASYIAIAPALVGCASFLILPITRHPVWTYVLLGAVWVACALVWFPLLWALVDGVELISSAVATVPLTLISLAALPLTSRLSPDDFGRKSASVIVFIALVCGVFAALLSSAHDPERPEGANIIVERAGEDDGARAMLVQTSLTMLGDKGPVIPPFDNTVTSISAEQGISAFTSRDLPVIDIDCGARATSPRISEVATFDVDDATIALLELEPGADATTIYTYSDSALINLPESLDELERAELVAELRAAISSTNPDDCFGARGSHGECAALDDGVITFGVAQSMHALALKGSNKTVWLTGVAVGLPEGCGQELLSQRPDWAVPVHIGDLFMTRVEHALD